MRQSNSTPTISDHLPIAVRAFADWGRRLSKEFEGVNNSTFSLIFDCETTTDPAQALRCGAYQVRKGHGLIKHGLFYEPDILTMNEQQLIAAYAAERSLDCLPVRQFVDDIVYGLAYDLGALIIGLNLPFDLSRLAISHGIARKAMKDGFTFKLSADKRRPNLVIKQLNSRAALIRFTAPYVQRTPRGMRKRGQKSAYNSGYFVDLRTLSAALFSRPFSLADLARHLKTQTQKIDKDEHGQKLTVAYLDYALTDVQVTWECFVELKAKYDAYGLATPVHKILSEASLGKAYFKAMNVRPWRELQPDFPAELLGRIMSTYYGGRSEVHLRRVQTRALYCDFLSMYPTVCTKMGLWRFMTAQGMSWRDATDEIRRFLREVQAEDFRQAEVWPRLNAIVKVRPDGDLFPVRANYSEDGSRTIGLNYLTSDKSLWFTLADCVVSKLLTNKMPDIIEAIAFEPKASQEDLKPISLLGNLDYRVDPNADDFFKRLIELRQGIKQQAKITIGFKKKQLDSAQLAAKIAANATSYGIFVEVNVRDEIKPKDVTCFGPYEPFKVKTKKCEQPGRYFHPLLASLITGAARLLLALLEHRIHAEGLDWALCDTDSMAIAKPAGMAEDEFIERARRVVSWFDSLNPYTFGGPLLKVEDENYSLTASGKIEQLYCFAISAKRYALFNLLKGKPIIRKLSAHGLGHLLPPYDEACPSTSIPAPQCDLKDTSLWHHDLWHQIIVADLQGKGAAFHMAWHSHLSKPSVSRYRASPPGLLAWFKPWNAGKSYSHSVKPFNFLLLFANRRQLGRKPCYPVAAFDKDLHKAACTAFDRATGDAVLAGELQSYQHQLAGYAVHAEAKFLNGDRFNVGLTLRRHIHAAAIEHIGKEADRLEDRMYAPELEDDLAYGAPISDSSQLEHLRKAIEGVAIIEIAGHTGLSSRYIGKIKRGAAVPSAMILSRILNAVRRVRLAREHERLLRQRDFEDLKQKVKRCGLRATAHEIGVDPSNLGKMLKALGKLSGS